MAGYQSKYKNYVGGKYGQQGFEEMVDVHFQQLATKIKLQGLTPALKKEQAFLEKIYKPFMKGD
tara:strand:- start:1359 stop:1550 length:192 start_codon:yes stop_codon:yes gene_type:complete